MTRRILATLALALASPVVFLAGLEAIAWVIGVRPLAEDPNHKLRDRLRRCRSDPAHLERCDATRWRDRAEGALTVFTLGASSMRGHPFGEKRNIPHYLRRGLEERRPGAYRVFNVARSCKDSIYLMRCTERLLDAAPDVLVVYAGHNDFAAFTRHEPRIPIWMARSGGWIENLSRAFARLRIASLLARRESLPLGPVEEQAPSLGGDALVRAQEIVLEHYAGNLERLIALADGRGVELVLVTVVSNLEFPIPRERWSDVALRADREEADAWERAYAGGIEAFRAKRYDAALERFKRARDARPYTRAPGMLNERLREIAARHDRVQLVDFERELDRVGAREGIGCNFFGTDEYCDGVHPNPRTNALLGAAIAETVLALPERARL